MIMKDQALTLQILVLPGHLQAHPFPGTAASIFPAPPVGQVCPILRTGMTLTLLRFLASSSRTPYVRQPK